MNAPSSSLPRPDQSFPTADPLNVPAEIKGWSWGAFLLNWIWGIGNNTFIALLALIPFVGFVMMVVLGAKGNAWAWRNGRWDSVEHFKRVQRKWAIWGAVVWLAMITLPFAIFGGTMYLLKHSDAYVLASEKLHASAEARSALGTPISMGFPMGAIETNGKSGRAILSLSVTGPKTTGRLFVEATKKDDQWVLTKLTLTPSNGGTINILEPTRANVISNSRTS